MLPAAWSVSRQYNRCARPRSTGRSGEVAVVACPGSPNSRCGRWCSCPARISVNGLCRRACTASESRGPIRVLRRSHQVTGQAAVSPALTRELATTGSHSAVRPRRSGHDPPRSSTEFYAQELFAEMPTMAKIRAKGEVKENPPGDGNAVY